MTNEQPPEASDLPPDLASIYGIWKWNDDIDVTYPNIDGSIQKESRSSICSSGVVEFSKFNICKDFDINGDPCLDPFCTDTDGIFIQWNEGPAKYDPNYQYIDPIGKTN